MLKRNLLGLVFASLLLGACAPMVPAPTGYPAPDERKTDSGKAETPPARRIEPESPKASAAQSAVERLLQEGWQLHRQGIFERSNAIAERALRLDRGNAEVYLLLASNYYSLWHLGMAEQIARQGLPLASGNTALQAKLRELLVEIQAKN